MLFYDWTMLLIIPGLLLGLWAQTRVKTTFEKYSRVAASFGGTAAEAARIILNESGNDDVSIQPAKGMLTDHYNPRNNTLSLSEDVMHSRSLAAIGVAAHEAGHAMQQHEGYAPLQLRTAIVPMVQIGANLAWPIFVMGLIMAFEPLQTAGIVLFSLAVLFALITLPVEFDASRRAVAMLTQSGIISWGQETEAVKAVLNAAAMTYVASAVSALLQLVRLLVLRNRNRD